MKRIMLMVVVVCVAMGAMAAKNGYFKRNTDDTIDVVATEAELVTLTVSGNATIAGTLDVTGDITGDLTTTKVKFIPAYLGKPGTTATVGWIVTGADKGLATLAQNATDDTLVIPITGLSLGDSVTGFKFKAQVDSGGNDAIIVCDIRKLTLASAGSSDASIGSTLIVTNAADAIISTNVTITATNEVIASGEVLYALVTATTGATTDFEVIGIDCTVTENP